MAEGQGLLMGYGSHTPQNQPRFVIRSRDRETTVYPIWNRRDGAKTGTRRVTAWSKWRTIAEYRASYEAEARARFAIAKRNQGLSQVAVFFGGKRLDW